MNEDDNVKWFLMSMINTTSKSNCRSLHKTVHLYFKILEKLKKTCLHQKKLQCK